MCHYSDAISISVELIEDWLELKLNYVQNHTVNPQIMLLKK